MSGPVVVGGATLYLGDCLDVLKGLPDVSVDAVVTDPPAGIGFMDKDWDHHKGGRAQWIAWMTEIAAECRRVLKPGGHALVWAIPRTSHWTATAWEDAGFEIRDRIAHVFGSGFPKSLDASKAIDKAAGVEREVVEHRRFGGRDGKSATAGASNGGMQGGYNFKDNRSITDPATDAARQWQGWGTALKPAMEDWWLCRKPLDGTVAQNVLTHGTGALNVDGCQIKYDQASDDSSAISGSMDDGALQGRWPANLIHDGSPEVVALFPETGPAKASFRGLCNSGRHGGLADLGGNIKSGTDSVRGIDDAGGSAARFFYCAKASRSDRGADNRHPTVKPTDLMRYLCRLVTSPGGTVLDPFMGSGSTGKAALMEGFRFIGIEREAEYSKIAEARIRAAQRQPDLLLISRQDPAAEAA